MALVPQSQYAEISDLTTLAITPAASQRFGNAAMDAQLQAASSVADSYVGSQYTLPLQAEVLDVNGNVITPQGWDMMLTLAVCNIAAFFLYSQFGFNPNGSNADKTIEDRYNQAIQYLSDIRDEKIFPQWLDSPASSGTLRGEVVSVSGTCAVGWTDTDDGDGYYQGSFSGDSDWIDV